MTTQPTAASTCPTSITRPAKAAQTATSASTTAMRRRGDKRSRSMSDAAAAVTTGFIAITRATRTGETPTYIAW